MTTCLWNAVLSEARRLLSPASSGRYMRTPRCLLVAGEVEKGTGTATESAALVVDEDDEADEDDKDAGVDAAEGDAAGSHTRQQHAPSARLKCC